MYKNQQPSGGTVALVILVVLSTIACSDSTVPTSPDTDSTATTTITAFGSQVLTSAILNAMDDAIQDEYLAEATYSRILADFGEVWPFVNVVQAERRHAAAVAGLFYNRGLEPPATKWNIDNVPRFNSFPEACAAAAQAERNNIALYDELLKMSLPRDVQNVFTNNRRASLEGHLPAFENCARN